MDNVFISSEKKNLLSNTIMGGLFEWKRICAGLFYCLWTMSSFPRKTKIF